MIEWSGIDDGAVKNPRSIETYLKNRILESQVSLLGEMDLDQPTNYGDTGWSLSELAAYLIEKPVIRDEMSHSNSTESSYPATISIWTISQAQNSDDGSQLWTNLEGYSQPHQANFARLFSNAIGKLELESFVSELKGAQRHITLARIHSMIPVFAVERYVALIKRAVKFHLPVENVLQEIQRAQDISESVKKLFSAKPEIGRDLVNRCLQSVMFGGHFGLPSRLINSLTFSIENRSKFRLTTAPVIYFNESFCEFEIRGVQGWNIRVGEDSTYTGGSLAPQSVFVSKDNNPEFQILEYERGFIFFDQEGIQIDGNRLPKSAGYIVWENGVSIKHSVITDTAYAVHSWPGWFYSYFEDVKSVEIVDKDGKTHYFYSSKTLQTRTSILPFLLVDGDELAFTKKNLPVYDSWPELLPGQVARITDNRTGEIFQRTAEGGSLDLGIEFDIDYTVSGGLGRTEDFRGLVIPELSIHGLDRPLLKGEERKIEIFLPQGWSHVGNFINFDSEENFFTISNQEGSLPWFRIKSPDGRLHSVGIDLPVLTWSVEYRNHEPIVLENELIQDIKQLESLQSIVLHNTHARSHRLLVRSDSPEAENSRVQPGVVRGSDIRYDLRSVWSPDNNSDIYMCLTWQSETIVLTSFRRQKPKRKLQSVKQEDLLRVALEIELFSEEDLAQFLAESRIRSIHLKSRARRSR